MVGFISLFFICLGYAEASDPALPLLQAMEGATNDEVRRHIRQVANERLAAATAAEMNMTENFGAWFQVGGASIDLPDSGGFRGALGLQLKL